MENQKSDQVKREIRVRNISPARHLQVKNIAAYYGITVDAFMKTEITKIVESYPEHIKNWKQEIPH